MVRKRTGKEEVEPERSDIPDPILVRCTLRVPRADADAVLPGLPLAFGCGGAVIRRKKNFVEVEATVEIRTVGDIVGKGVPVLVTERLPIAPVPRDELITDAAAWFKHVRRLG